MRLCTPLSLCLAAAAVLLSGPAHADARPTCAGPDDRSFPITTRIHGGPGAYEAGGGYGTFLLDLTNTTDRTCAAIHPVLVLVDSRHALKAGQPRLEFYDAGRPHPVRFSATDQDELVGPFDAGLPGFTVEPHRTVTVKVRLALTSDAVANDVTAKAAVVQRHEDDGDWVGQSNDYRFRVHGAPAMDAASDPPAKDPRSTGRPDASKAPRATTTPQATGASDPAGRPRPTADSSTGTGKGTGTAPSPAPTASDDGLPFADELAGTGLDTPLGVITATALLLAAGGTVVLTWRRR
ncbi:hypothetical protein [Streptomyces sp. NPDC086766]|uniref:hypothetical protein n=1 Tax=Streptomyces sp. NPDC086766 TaxID=3365754 RepID=UPI0038051387